MKKLFVCMLTILLMAPALLWANGKGLLNVVTGKPEAQIYIDGEFIAKNFVNSYPLESGEHYVRVEYAGKLMYAKMVQIYPDETKSITSENFVDIKTNVANRGAMDREAERLQETKGQVGIGLMAGTNFPASGISLKWMPLGFLGVQVSGMGGIKINDTTHSQAGLRLIYEFGKKVLWNSVFTGYIAPGVAWVDEANAADSTKSFKGLNAGVNLGLEWALFDPLYFSVEVGTVYQKRQDSGNDGFLMCLSGGFHFFF